MRVLHIAPAIFGEDGVVGGAERYALELAKHMAAEVPTLFAAFRQADVIHCHQQHILASSMASLACRLTGRKVFVSDLGGGGWDVSAYISTDRWYHGHLHISEYSRSVFGHAQQPWAHVI